MTLAEVLDNRVRKILNDAEGGDNRWETSDLIIWWNDYVRILFKQRPVARISATGTEISHVEHTAKTEHLVIDDAWMPPGIDYVCHRAYDMDAGDTRDLDRSVHHWDLFKAGIAM